MKKLNLNAIRIDGGTQSRVEINNDAVSDYAEAIKVGIEFPAIVVFHDGADYWLADGFHRYHAHKQAGKASIEAEVHSGTVRDAVLHSLGANRAHGLRMTNADKRKSVSTLLADPEWAKWSDRKIAELCGVTHPFVAGIRAPKVVTVTTHAPAGRPAGVASGAPAKSAHATPAAAPAAKKLAPWDKPAAAPAPDAAAFDGFDPVAELEATQKLLEAADRRIEALTTDDVKAELNKQIGIRQGIEARLSLEMAKVGQLQKELDSYGKWFADLRKVTGLEKRSDITKLCREAANNKSEAV